MVIGGRTGEERKAVDLSRRLVDNRWNPSLNPLIPKDFMEDFYRRIVVNLRHLMAHILELHIEPSEFLGHVTRAAKELDPERLEARVYEVDFLDNTLFLRASTQVDVNTVEEQDRAYPIRPRTITGDAIIENRVIVATREEGYAHSRFRDGEDVRAAFPIEFFETDMEEGRTRYVLVVDKKGAGPLSTDIVNALRDYSILAGLAISIKELRDQLGHYYEQNRNLVLSGRHSASIAHDIRSLNVGVGGFLNIALRRLQSEFKSEDAVEIIQHLTLARENSGHIETLLNNFAQFNRTKMTLHRDTDMGDVVRKTLHALASRDDFRNLLLIDMDVSPDPTGVLVDPDWFGTVLENIVKNSIEACPDQCRISVRLARTDDSLVLTLEDNCGGIPVGLLPDVFTPFKSTKKRGQGLGLANAKKVVEEHGGSISVGNGSTLGAVFTIRFPLSG